MQIAPLSSPAFSTDYFSHQGEITAQYIFSCARFSDRPVNVTDTDGAQLYSINHDGGNARTRWGFSWNNEDSFGSNDVVGGIGVSSNRDAAAHFSAGDVSDTDNSCEFQFSAITV